MASKLISIIIPIYNEVEGIAEFLSQKVFPVVNNITEYKTEIILVDDGSTDGTLPVLQAVAARRKDVRLVALSRNFGKEMALSAGLRYAKGAAAITLDADGQQPPELIPKFIQKWEAGAEVVTGVRDRYTKHGLVARLGSKVFYWLMDKMGAADTTVPGSTDFRLMDRVVIDEYNRLTEHNRITRGLVGWLGFRQEYIKYTYGTRMAGRPSYSFPKLFRLAVDSFISMSIKPIVVFGYVGVFICVGSFILGAFCIINQYILGDPLGLYWNGAVQMAIFITFLVGLVLISQTITALYISHIHAETQNRPIFIVDRRQSRNLDPSDGKK